MRSFDELLTWLTLAALFLGVFGFYGWALWRQTRRFFAAMIRLRDRIDRSDDSLR